jgi:hypothetical protein
MTPARLLRRPRLILLICIVVYFVVFPEDLAPIERILHLSQAVSPWLYVVLGAGIVAWAIVRTWARRPTPPAANGVPPQPML